MNSSFAKGIVIGGISIAGIALIPAALGFGSAGIVGGSIAAGIQSIIGNVAAGSLFSFFQSLGMTGFFTGVAAKAATIAVTVGALFASKIKK